MYWNKRRQYCSYLKGADFTLVLMASKDSETGYPVTFHIGFMQKSRQAVTDIYNRLRSGNIEAGTPEDP
jgi:hypothetical protein